jgi:hypothetical protein
MPSSSEIGPLTAREIQMPRETWSPQPSSTGACDAAKRPLARTGVFRKEGVASAGSPQVTFNLVDFYHKERQLIGVDTLKLSFGESAEIRPDIKAETLLLIE